MQKLTRRMPAEWEKHLATWIAWPHEETDWPHKFETIPWVYTEIARSLALSEQVEVVVKDEEQKLIAKRMLEKNGVLENVRLHVVKNDRSWLRDSAPTAVKRSDGSVEWICWRFNSWAKYDNYSADQFVSQQIAKITELPFTLATRADNGEPLVLEGGAIEADGQGTLLVTEECLLSEVQARNPGLGKNGYEQAFAEYLGVSKTIWLVAGCEGDDTHGHIDDIARFVAPETVVVVSTEDPLNPNYKAFQENLKILRLATDAKGKKLNVITLPSPRRIVFNDEVLPASYANFYIANSVVIVPTFNDPADRIALNILSDLFPTRKVFGVSAMDLILGQGTLHCLTQQQVK